MLVATVVPCRTRSSVSALRPASPSASRTRVMKALEGSLGPLGVLARQTRPLAASCRATSVKVPPMSTATASEDLREGIKILFAMESARLRPVGAKRSRRRFIDGVAADCDAIKAARSVDADETAAHILEHGIERPIEW